MLVDAAQIAAAQGDAVAVEEFENLDRDLATVVDPVAELRRGELAVRRSGAEIDNDADHLGHGLAQKEMIVSDLVSLAHAAEKLEQAPDVGLALAQQRGNVTHARRPEPLGAAKERRDFLPDFFVHRRETDFVA